VDFLGCGRRRYRFLDRGCRWTFPCSLAQGQSRMRRALFPNHLGFGIAVGAAGSLIWKDPSSLRSLSAVSRGRVSHWQIPRQRGNSRSAMTMKAQRKILSVAGSRKLTAERVRSVAASIKGELASSTGTGSTMAAGRRYLGHFGTSDRRVTVGSSARSRSR